MFFLQDIAQLADPPPWWGDAVLAGGFLVLGAVIGFLFNWLLEDRKAKREQTHKWDDLIREHGANAIAAASLLPTELDTAADLVIAQMAEAIKKVSASGGEAVLNYRRASSPAHRDLVQECASLELVAPRTIQDASTELRTTANALVRASIQAKGVPMGVGETPATVKDLERDSAALQKAIRYQFQIR